VTTKSHSGWAYQQTSVDTYSKVAFAKLHDRKNALDSGLLANEEMLNQTVQTTAAMV